MGQDQLLGLEGNLRGVAPCCTHSLPLVLLEPLEPFRWVLLDGLCLFQDGRGRGSQGDLGPRRRPSSVLKEVVGPTGPLLALREAPIAFCNAPKMEALISRNDLFRGLYVYLARRDHQQLQVQVLVVRLIALALLGGQRAVMVAVVEQVDPLFYPTARRCSDLLARAATPSTDAARAEIAVQRAVHPPISGHVRSLRCIHTCTGVHRGCRSTCAGRIPVDLGDFEGDRELDVLCLKREELSITGATSGVAYLELGGGCR